MAQIIKNRRGPIGNLKAATANNGELIVASGSIGNLSGPFTFIGSPTPSDNGSAGAFRAVSKIYTGATAPTISNITYGTVLDGTPFYASDNNSLYILNNDGTGNTQLDLTGNIEGNTINSVTINTLAGSVDVQGDITGSNLNLSGNATIAGNIVLGGNITLGDQDVDFVSFNADVSSSIIPDAAGTYDLGSPSKTWANVYADNISVTGVQVFDDITVSGSLIVSQSTQLQDTLDVDGQATLASVNVEDLTNNSVVIVGAGGELEDDVNFTFDGTTLTVGEFTVNQSTGAVNTTGDLTVGGTTNLNGNVFISGSLTMLEAATSLVISSSVVEIDDNIIRLNAFAPFERYAGFEVIDSGSTGVSASLLWDSQNDYWLIQSSSAETGKVISTTFGSKGSESSLTTNLIPKATGLSSIGNSLLGDSGTTLTYDTDALTVAATSGNTTVKGILTLPNAGGTDAGSDSSNIAFRDSSNRIGYVASTDTTAVMDQMLGYRASDGRLVFSSVIDGGTF